MRERLAYVSRRNIYDDHPEGHGEFPGPVPIEGRRIKSSFKSPQDLERGIGHAAEEALEQHDGEVAVGIKYGGPRKTRVFLAKDPRLIVGFGVAVAGIILASAVVKHRRNK